MKKSRKHADLDEDEVADRIRKMLGICARKELELCLEQAGVTQAEVIAQLAKDLEPLQQLHQSLEQAVSVVVAKQRLPDLYEAVIWELLRGKKPALTAKDIKEAFLSTAMDDFMNIVMGDPDAALNRHFAGDQALRQWKERRYRD